MRGRSSWLSGAASGTVPLPAPAPFPGERRRLGSAHSRTRAGGDPALGLHLTGVLKAFPASWRLGACSSPLHQEVASDSVRGSGHRRVGGWIRVGGVQEAAHQ